MKKRPARRPPLSPEMEAAAARLAGRARGPLRRLEQAALRAEELLGRAQSGFLGGNLMAIVNGAILREMRRDTAQAIAEIGRRETSDVVDEADLYSSAVGELAALFKLLTEVELGEQPGMRAEWEKLSEELLACAAELQEALEEFEDASEHSEAPSAGLRGVDPALAQRVWRQARAGLRGVDPALAQRVWRQARAGAKMSGEEARLAQLMREHAEHHAAFEQAGQAGGEADPFLHLTLHMAVENQLESDDPPEARAALERLTAGGLVRHEALHRIAGGFQEEMAGGSFDRARYARRLREL